MHVQYDDYPQRQQLMASNIHALLHMADQIRDVGSVYVWWEFPLERFGGMLISVSAVMVMAPYWKSHYHLPPTPMPVYALAV